MIFLSSSILVLYMISHTLASADIGEVNEVLYKDANTVETFMRTREFKVSGQCNPYRGPTLNLSLR